MCLKSVGWSLNGFILPGQETDKQQEITTRWLGRLSITFCVVLMVSNIIIKKLEPLQLVMSVVIKAVGRGHTYRYTPLTKTSKKNKAVWQSAYLV